MKTKWKSAAGFRRLSIIGALLATQSCVPGPCQDPAAETREPVRFGCPLNPMLLKCPAPSITLRGQVSLSEQLPAVDTTLRMGARFDTRNLPPNGECDEWYEIPEWYAGRWHTEKCLTYYRKSLRTGFSSYDHALATSRANEDCGTQLDATGAIWEAHLVPYTQFVESDQVNHVLLMQECRPVSISDREVSMYFRGTHLVVDKESLQIMNTVQSEAIQTYRPIGYGVVQCSGQCKHFDECGKPITIARTTSTKVRTRDFIPVERWKGCDLRSSFANFLSRRGLAWRIPAGMQLRAVSLPLSGAISLRRPRNAR